MADTLKYAFRNLLRYRRRSLLTGALITLSVAAVLLFLALSGSFKGMMVAQMTDSMLGHLQVHRKGYMASIDNLPLNLNIGPGAMAKLETALQGIPDVAAWSPRVKFGAGFSNFMETTSIRLNGVEPEREAAVCPALAKRVTAGDVSGGLLKPGEVLIPDLLARGMKVGPGDTVVLVATNRDGSVNGKTFVVRGVLEGITGPGGRDGYIHIDDARELLRLASAEVSEVAVRLNDFDRLDAAFAAIQKALEGITNKEGKPALDAHRWEALSPFANIARLIDVMTVSIEIMLVAVVLISVMNVMVMAVYERIREIGTLAALGTRPGRILGLYVTEGFLLGLAGTAAGVAIALVALYALNVFPITFAFGRQTGLVLAPAIGATDVLWVCALVIGVSVLASLQPARKAARMDPITALRHV